MISVVLSLAGFLLFACEAEPEKPLKREFRAVWVATFHNIDWPGEKGLEPTRQQVEFLELVRYQHLNGMNALFVQVRPSGDAFYPSKLAPWSEYLTGEQGKPPRPYYDPLDFMINATHDRNMEFHAWINPFRTISHVRFSNVSEDNIARRKPEWTYQYGNTVYLNPGIPAVRDHLTQVVLEIARNYDVDGIHFDDYFYPYQEPGVSLNDEVAFEQYPDGYTDIHAWRRHNIDLFIKQVSDSLRVVAPHIKFGISPVGVWRNIQDDPLGSNSKARSTSYDGLYADVRKWTQEGWLDYIAPQLYWSNDHPRANYDALLPWWASNAFGRHLYIGQAVFKLKTDNGSYWRNPTQLPYQLSLNRRYPSVNGSIFYSANSFQGNPHQIETLLREDRFRYPALIPSMAWKDSIPPLAPQHLKAEVKEGQIRLHWNAPPPAPDGETADYYVLYRFSRNEAPDPERSDRIVSIQKATVYTDRAVLPQQRYTYLLTAVDRLHNESRTGVAIVVGE